MTRSNPLSSTPESPRLDLATKAMVAVVLGVTAWLMALPLSSSIQQATLARFHLRSSNFLCWALQQPIPAMYSFENRYWLNGPRETAEESSLVNHFPLRLLTFGDNRYRLLHQHQPLNLVVRSRYRNQQLTTICRATPKPDGGFRLTKMNASGETP